MYLMIIQLFKNEYKEDLYLALSSAGITMITYCDGHNLDYEITNKLPLFSGLLKHHEEKERYATIYFCTTESLEDIDAVTEGFEVAGIDWKQEEIFKITVIKSEKVIP